MKRSCCPSSRRCGHKSLVPSLALLASVGIWAGTLAETAHAQPLAAQRLDPIRLVRPLAAETIKRLFDEAEGLYRARQYAQAMEAFRQLAEYDPDHAHAWLRIGNLHQHRREIGRAAQAFRKVVSLAGAAADEEVRRKALLNLGLIGLQEVRLVLRSLERSGGSASASEVSVLEQLEDEAGSLEAALARWTRQGGEPGASGTPERGERAAGRGRAMPPVEYIRGAPQP